MNIVKKGGNGMEEKRNNIIPIVKGVIISYILTLILIAIYSLILAKTGVPESSIPTCTIVICILSNMYIKYFNWQFNVQ